MSIRVIFGSIHSKISVKKCKETYFTGYYIFQKNILVYVSKRVVCFFLLRLRCLKGSQMINGFKLEV